MVEEWFALKLHSEEVLGSIPGPDVDPSCVEYPKKCVSVTVTAGQDYISI